MTTLLRLSIIITLNLPLISCVDRFYDHGYLPDQDKIDKIKINSTSKSLLKPLLGSPAFKITEADQENWYYMQTKKKYEAFLKGEIVENNIVKISTKDNIVTALKTYDLNDMNKISFSTEATDKTKAKLGIIEQILNNAGRFADRSDF